MKRLENKVVVITASTRGIGKACAEECAKEGAIVYLAARNLERAENVKNELMDKYQARVEVVYNDASKLDTFETMIDEVVDKEGRIDGLVNNFGTSNPQLDRDIANTDYETFKSTVDTNLASVFLTSKKAIEHMSKKNYGNIVNISSVAGVKPDISQVAYGVSKDAINYLTKLIATQAAKDGIRANAVLPGMIGTDAVKEKLSEEFKQVFTKHIPLGDMGEPSDIAKAVVFLLSDDAKYITGQILEVSGGFGLPTPVYGDLSKNNVR